MTTEDISHKRIHNILSNYCKDKANLLAFEKSLGNYFSLYEDDIFLVRLNETDRQRLVEAYNKYRAAPYMWYERETSGDK